MWICRIFHIFDGCAGASPYTTHSADIRNAATQWHEAYELILGFFFSFLARNWLWVYYSINYHTTQSGPVHCGLSVERFFIRTVENSVSELQPELPANRGLLLKHEDFTWFSSSCSLAPKSPRQIGTYGVYITYWTWVLLSIKPKIIKKRLEAGKILNGMVSLIQWVMTKIAPNEQFLI